MCVNVCVRLCVRVCAVTGTHMFASEAVMLCVSRYGMGICV